MFVLLSKVLPLLIYPLGLVCWVFLLGLLTIRTRPRATAIALSLAVAYLWLSSTTPVMYAIVGSLERQYRPTELPEADAIVLLGGATRPAIEPRAEVDLRDESDRIVRAAQLYRDGKSPFIVASGGRLKWGTDPLPVEASEAYDMARILQLLGVPETSIILEPNSRNTYENAVFVQPILEERNINRILLVTSAMHMPRSLLIFQKLGIEAIAAPTDFIAVPSQDSRTLKDNLAQQLIDALPQASNLALTTRAMKEYVGLVVYRLKGWL
ncbi:MAG: YdcF family protein [Cyanobacteria bacterium J06597_1]